MNILRFKICWKSLFLIFVSIFFYLLFWYYFLLHCCFFIVCEMSMCLASFWLKCNNLLLVWFIDNDVTAIFKICNLMITFILSKRRNCYDQTSDLSISWTYRQYSAKRYWFSVGLMPLLWTMKYFYGDTLLWNKQS